MIHLEDTDPPVPSWVRYFLDDVVLLQTVFWLTAIVMILVLAVKLWPVLSKFVTIVNSTAGLPKFIDEMNTRRTEDDARHEKLARQVAEIHHEVNYNNGSSIKDGVRRIEGQIALLIAEDAAIREDFGITEDKRRRQP